MNDQISDQFSADKDRRTLSLADVIRAICEKGKLTMNHDANEPDAAELNSQIGMSQFTIDQLTMRERRLDAELTSARRRQVGVHTAAVAVPMTIGAITLAACHALDTIGFAQVIFIITIVISTISTAVIAAAGIHDNEIGRIAEDLADTREQIDKATLKHHAMMQKMITRM